MSETKKWWEVANNQDEFKLFNELARHPDYTWRTVKGLADALGWSEEKLRDTMKKFISQNIIVSGKTSKDANQPKVAYWERAKEEPKKQDLEEDLPF